MNHKEWQAIERARDLLQLGDRATLGEIKRAYHRLSKEHHPDLVDSDRKKKGEDMMYQLTSAYELLMDYCSDYRFPLAPDENSIYDAEDWWLDRFGQDPLWGRSKRRRR